MSGASSILGPRWPPRRTWTAQWVCPPGLLGLSGPQYCLPGPQYCLSWPAGRLLDATCTSNGRQVSAKLDCQIEFENGCQCRCASSERQDSCQVQQNASAAVCLSLYSDRSTLVYIYIYIYVCRGVPPGGTHTRILSFNFFCTVGGGGGLAPPSRPALLI